MYRTVLGRTQNTAFFSAIRCTQSRRCAMSTKPHVGVIGAGFSGLRCADILVQNGARVTILEARDRVGGRVCFALIESSLDALLVSLCLSGSLLFCLGTPRGDGRSFGRSVCWLIALHSKVFRFNAGLTIPGAQTGSTARARTPSCPSQRQHKP